MDGSLDDNHEGEDEFGSVDPSSMGSPQETLQGDMSLPHVSKFVEGQMKMSLRKYRTDFHKHYKCYKTDEAACANPPKRLRSIIED
ncbi:hypothetical protein E5676_scaffold313G002350 [Cucumis melo var. makuwa]|uniref:CACTA en-spm transposon protein n=1 Tax=Cucumis melo var. makuwa TaxID=1194695 RepID=A0A5D3DSN7_CUCMM|nr:hypothetical protein E6C27_scaffold154G001510 [Cucumis melo var. makuwa]TYK26603.1 hypothetical protein E5676_scaffold313G002350 [Cucumis melo var. makuwa]